MMKKDVAFKFNYFKNGYAQGLFAKKGKLQQDCVRLGNETLSYDQIVDTTTRDQRIVLALFSTDTLSPKLRKMLAGESAIVLQVYGVRARELERQIDRIASQQAFERRKNQMLQLGQGNLLRSVSCPECESAIDLTEFERTDHIYCRFCESTFKENHSTLIKGDAYRTCDECGMFDRVKSYTEFYFYFLLIVYGFSYKRRYMCDHCAHNLFMRMLLINLIFVLGVPFAIYNKIKSVMGRNPALRQLAYANSLAKKGQYQKAKPIYERLHQSHFDHPGLLMNEGIGHLNGQDIEGAVKLWQEALQSCSNYHPVLRLFHKLNESGNGKRS